MENIFQRGMPDREDFTLSLSRTFEANVFDLIATRFKKLLEAAPAQTVEINRETLTIADKIKFYHRTDRERRRIRFEDLFETDMQAYAYRDVSGLCELIRLGLVKIYR